MNKKIVIIYDNYLRRYVDKEVSILEAANIPVELKHINEVTLMIPNRLPVFALEKQGKYSNFLSGKFNDDRVLEWARKFDWSQLD